MKKIILLFCAFAWAVLCANSFSTRESVFAKSEPVSVTCKTGETQSGFSQQHNEERGILFNKEIAEDATLPVLTEVLKLKTSGINRMVFEKGVYHFYPEKAWEVYRYISNHDNQLIRTPFPLIGINELTIDGQGSTFIFHGVMIPFLVDGSSNISIKNLSVDWATPFHSEATIIANNPAENTYDIKISEKYPYEIRNGNLIFLKEYFEHTVGQMYIFDPETKGVAYNTQQYSTWWVINQPVTEKVGRIEYKYDYSDDRYDPNFSTVGQELKSRFRQLEPGIVRVYNHTSGLPPVGMVMVMKGAKGVNRVAPAFHVTQTNGFIGENVNVYHAGGMGIIAENSSDITLNNFNVVPSKGRLVSATADATHFVGCRGKLHFNHCSFTNQLDDGTNIHGAYQEVVDVLNENSLGVRIGHFQQQGFLIGEPGDTIGIINKEKSIFPFVKLTLKSLRQMNGGYMLITFNEKLPGIVNPGDLLENQTAYPEVLIENCNFSKNRAHGVLLASTKKTVVRNNFFHTDMDAILLPAHMGHWYESGHACNVLIENNVFQDCSYGGGNGGVIQIHAGGEFDEHPIKNISISNNTFKQFDNLILDVRNVEGLVFKENEIVHSGNFPQLHPENPAFRIQKCEEVVFEKNNCKSTAKKLIDTEGDMPFIKFK